jgi:hypothetical protein
MTPHLRNTNSAAVAALMTCLLFSTTIGHAGWRELFGIGRKNTNQLDTASASLASLSQEQVAQGLKEALAQGVHTAVAELGREGGFLTNLNVRIPMPPQLQKVESTLRALRQDHLADEFVVTMNRAAEQAVPEAVEVFKDAINRISIEDAKSILTGPDDAATQYFRRVTETNLAARFLPIVQGATAKSGVTQSYKQLVSAGIQNRFLGALGSVYFDPESLDIDRYITDRALDGLFKMVAREEKLIRANPLARTSSLLQKVFGAVSPPAK